MLIINITHEENMYTRLIHNTASGQNDWNISHHRLHGHSYSVVVGKVMLLWYARHLARDTQ